MEFKIVEVPETPRTDTSQLVDALITNVGKAIEVAIPGKDPNTFRKNLRSALSARNTLLKFVLGTKSSTMQIEGGSTVQSMLVWLTPKA